jgi:hypothetical protein
MRRDLSTLDRDIGQPWSRIIQEAFKHGIDCDIIYGGLIPGRDEQGLYEVSDTQNYLLGSRRVSPGGQVYRYAKATNIITSCKFGVKFWALSSDGIESTLVQKQVKDNLSILIAGDFAKDELLGGTLIIHVAGGLEQQRVISGNTVKSGDNITIYLRDPLTADVALGTYVEVYPNPYSNVYCFYLGGGHPAGAFSSVAGMPNVITAAANRYLWIQTWGPIWINPYDAVGSTPVADTREVVFDHEGAISYESEVKGISATAFATKHQVAGFIINRQATGVSGPPVIMLQISP